jgi:electron transport complex protein RnfG
VGTLGAVAVVAGLAIVLVYQWARPQIEAHDARELRQAIQQVLGEPESYRTRWVRDGSLLDSLPAGADSSSATRVYAGYGESGRLLGYAIPGEKPGYQDVVGLIFGYDPGRDLVLGMKVLESKETPGLGAKIVSDSSFLGEFHGVEPPLEGVKEGGAGPHEVDMITGATISSKTVIEIINERLHTLKPALTGGSDAAAGAAPSGGGATPSGAVGGGGGRP